MSTDPTRLSVDLEDPQSWNRYAYANNNPFRYVDRNGKWSTAVHGEIIDESLRSKLSESDREWIKKGSAYVDGDQSLAGAPKHGVRKPFQSPDEAKQIGEAFVSTQIDAAVRAQLQHEENGVTGWSPVALFDFGMAQHTPADADSPWHDQWNNIWWGVYALTWTGPN